MNRIVQISTLLGVIVCGLSACEGGRISQSNPRADLNGFIAAQGGVISAQVDNSLFEFKGDKRLTYAQAMRRNLKVVSLASDDNYWQIQGLPLEPGRYPCDDTLQLSFQREGMNRISSTNGNCELTLVVATLQTLAGQFSGRLTDDAGHNYLVEEGVFEIQIDQAIPDLDQDGLSDADDNCPFTANADQRDSDGNRRGDACEPDAEDDA